MNNRQILELLGITQEILHSFKTKGKLALVPKLYLIKSFDKVNWTFLRHVLLQIGIRLDGVNLIMGCAVALNFSILVIGSSLGFFVASRGIIYRCPLSSLLFV